MWSKILALTCPLPCYERSFGIWVLHVLLFLVSSCPSLTQEVPKQAAPTLRSQADLVEIPVLVRRRAKHVPGLRLDNFTVLEDGVKQRIVHFDEISEAGTEAILSKPEPGVYTYNLWDQRVAARITVLVFDLLNTPFLKQVYVRDSLVRFLDALPRRRDPLMLAAFTTDGLKIIHFFTTDPSVLRAAISRTKSRMGEMERASELQRSKAEATEAAISAVAARNGGHVDADDPEVQRLKELFQTVPDSQTQTRDINKTTLTLLMMQQLARSLSGIPGRKSMIWSTGGISYVQGSEAPSDLHSGFHKSEGLPQSRIANNNDMFEKTWQMLSNANIAVYVVDMEELSNPGYTDASYDASQVTSFRVQGFGLRSQAMNGFTDRTGGKYCPLRAQLENCFSDAIEDSSQYYMLGYYPKDRNRGGWRKLKVEVAARGTSVHARSGYFYVSPAERPEARGFEVAEALGSPLDATGIRLTLRWIEPVSAEAKEPSTRSFEIAVDPRDFTIDSEKANHFRISVTVASRDEKGKYTGELAKTIEGDSAPEDLKRIFEKGLVYRDSIDLPPGEVQVRVVVRDEVGGRVGSVTGMPAPPKRP